MRWAGVRDGRDALVRIHTPSPHLQAAATSFRFGGTLFASFVGLALYPCGTTHKHLSDRGVIAMTAAFPAAVCLLSFLLPEERDKTASATALPRWLTRRVARVFSFASAWGHASPSALSSAPAAASSSAPLHIMVDPRSLPPASAPSAGSLDRSRLALLFLLVLPLQAAVLWAQVTRQCQST